MVAVDVHVRGQASQLLLDIFIDSVAGVTHEACRMVSKGVEERLDGDPWYARLRTIDVSSPGADTPVVFLWQLAKHVGRTVLVQTTDGSTVEGALVAATDEALTVSVTTGTGKARSTTDVVLTADGIKEARVVVRI